MAETLFSRGYKMKLIGTGLEAGTWGTSTNENLKRIDQTLGGTSDNFVVTAPPGESSWSSPTVTWLLQDSTDAWVTGSDGRNRYINFKGTPGVNVTVDIRGNSSTDVNNERVYWVRNSMTPGDAPGFTITFDGGDAGNTFVLANGATALIYSDNAGKAVGILDSLQVAGLDFTQEATGAAVIKLPTNKASALLFEDTTTTYDFVKFDTATSASKLTLGAANTNLDIDSPELDLTTRTVDIKLKNSELRALDFVSDSDVRILTLDTNTTTVEIPSGSTLDIASSGTSKVSSGGTLEVKSGGTLQVDSGSTLNIQSVLTATGGVVIGTLGGTIDNQVIGGVLPVDGTFAVGTATTGFKGPLLNATGATGAVKFGDAGDVGLKIDSGVLKIKAKTTESYVTAGPAFDAQTTGDGAYKEITGISADADASTENSHGFNPAIPRLCKLILVCGSPEYGYVAGEEFDASGGQSAAIGYSGYDFGARLVIDDTNATVVVGIDGMQVLRREAGPVGFPDRSYIQLTPAKWSFTVRMWK